MCNEYAFNEDINRTEDEEMDEIQKYFAEEEQKMEADKKEEVPV